MKKKSGKIKIKKNNAKYYRKNNNKQHKTIKILNNELNWEKNVCVFFFLSSNSNQFAYILTANISQFFVGFIFFLLLFDL